MIFELLGHKKPWEFTEENHALHCMVPSAVRTACAAHHEDIPLRDLNRHWAGAGWHGAGDLRWLMDKASNNSSAKRLVGIPWLRRRQKLSPAFSHPKLGLILDVWCFYRCPIFAFFRAVCSTFNLMLWCCSFCLIALVCMILLLGVEVDCNSQLFLSCDSKSSHPATPGWTVVRGSPLMVEIMVKMVVNWREQTPNVMI